MNEWIKVYFLLSRTTFFNEKNWLHVYENTHDKMNMNHENTGY